jgi:hypothetical protein
MFPHGASLAVALLALGFGPAHAHDIYSDFTDANGHSCCDNGDCRPADYRLSLGGVDMFVYGQWFAVPSDKIQYRAVPGDTGRTRGGHWCGSFGSDAPGSIALIHTHCAILPPRSTSRSHVAAK